MVDTNSTNRVPQFCAICGARLAPSENVQGYDPYTGNPVSEQSLHCTNPSVQIQGRFAPKQTLVFHPSWTNENGVWVQG